ncbi:MAG: hypothetical protein K2L11_11380 [Muribaculaceae bacterium]|nr:hypothetical protein [Muribaculaceae bacterium]
MKKTLLLSATLAATCSAFAGVHSVTKADASSFIAGPKAPAISKTQTLTRADGDMETLDFTYADEPFSSYGLNGTTGGKTRVYTGFIMTADDVKAFAGRKAIGFSVYSPTSTAGIRNSISDARFFYSTDPEVAKLDYEQDFTMSKSPFSLTSVSMDEPYTISGDEEGIFFGYSLVVPKKNDMCYIPADDNTSGPYNTCIFGASDTENLPDEFYSITAEIGALCMSVKLERETLPKYVDFTYFPSTMAIPMGEASAYPLTLKATCGAPIESVNLEYTYGGKTYDNAIAFDTPIPAGVSRYISTAVEFPALSELINEDVEFKLTKINGTENTGNNMSAWARVAVVEQLPARQTLIEEFTGTWCPNCPRGFAALEYMKKNYPDFVLASYHNGDPMQITDEYPAAISGFPQASLNRDLIVDPYYGTQAFNMELPIVGDILAENAVPTPWQVSVSHEWESDDVLVAKAEAANVAGFKDCEYSIAYLLIADGISGKGRDWFQSNNYNTQNPVYIEELNAFCRGGEYGKASVAGLVYDDVVISTNGIYGLKGSIPSEVEPYQAIDHSVKYDLSKIPSDLLPDKNKLRVVAAVVDSFGYVLNCAKDEVNDFATDAVNGILDETAPVEYFNLNGMKVANPTEGVFIRRQGTRTEKVIVK